MEIDQTMLIYIVAIVAGILGFVFATSKKKKVMEKSKWFFAAPLLIICFGLVAYNMGYLDSYISGAGLSAVSTTTPGGSQIVTTAEDTTVTWAWVNKYTSLAAGGTHAYRVSSDGGMTYAPTKTVSDSGTDTLSPGDVVQTLFGNGTDATYFGVVTQETIPNKGTYTIDAQTVANGTLTMRAFNEEGNLIDSAGENETISAGDTVNLKIEIQGPNKQGFPYGGVLTLEVNGSEYDEAENSLSCNDLTLSKTNTPSVHTISDTANKVISYSVSAIEGTAVHICNLHLDADDTADPSDANDPTITFRPNDYFINEDNGGAFEGPSVEDEDNAQTFEHVTTLTVNTD